MHPLTAPNPITYLHQRGHKSTPSLFEKVNKYYIASPIYTNHALTHQLPGKTAIKYFDAQP